MNLPSNTPSDRERPTRQAWPAERRPEAPEVDWPALVRRCVDGDHGAWTEAEPPAQGRFGAIAPRVEASAVDPVADNRSFDTEIRRQLLPPHRADHEMPIRSGDRAFLQ